MGKVFAWHEVEAGHIPHRTDFTQVVHRIRTDVEGADALVGGVLCGSVLWGGASERSDIDCVLFYNPRMRKEAFGAMRSMGAAAAVRHVPLELIPLAADMAPTYAHHLNLLFVKHLERSVKQGGLLKKNLLLLLSFSPHTSALLDTREYLRRKMRTMEKGLAALPVMETAARHKFFQKVLEVPVHIARKMLAVNGAEVESEAKRDIMRAYRAAASPCEWALASRLTATDSAYTRELLAQRKKPDERRYGDALEEVEARAWDALEFVRLSVSRIA